MSGLATAAAKTMFLAADLVPAPQALSIVLLGANRQAAQRLTASFVYVVSSEDQELPLRSLNERRELCRQMADEARSAGDAGTAAQWEAAVQEAKERSSVLRHLLEREWTHPGEGEPEAASGQ